MAAQGAKVAELKKAKAEKDAVMAEVSRLWRAAHARGDHGWAAAAAGVVPTRCSHARQKVALGTGSALSFVALVPTVVWCARARVRACACVRASCIPYHMFWRPFCSAQRKTCLVAILAQASFFSTIFQLWRPVHCADMGVPVLKMTAAERRSF